MKVIIAGSRTIKSMELLETALASAGYHITEVVSGGAGGADSLGEEWAINNKIPLKRFPVSDFEWKRSPQAGHNRNAKMADYADAAIILWDGKSRGTQNMIDNMNRRAKPHYVLRGQGEPSG
jgi:hypothetical protein